MLTVEQKVTIQLTEADIEQAITAFVRHQHPEIDAEDYKVEVKLRKQTATVVATKSALPPIVEELTDKQEAAIQDA
jgi:hypothetical protein